MPIDDSIASKPHSAIGHRLHSHRHTALLIAIIALLGVRPLIGESSVAHAVFSVVVVLVLVIALYTIQVDELLGDRERSLHHRKHRGALGWMLAIAAIAFRLGDIVYPSHQLVTASSIVLLFFFLFVAVTELRGVLKHKIVTRETISMSISIYLLLGLTWGFLFIVLFDFQPQAFSFGGAPAPSEQQVTPVLIYFSLTTLATVGYGDITPLTLQARYAAVSEGIAGQFYLAILVARLVSMQMSQSASSNAEAEADDSDTKERSAGDR